VLTAQTARSFAWENMRAAFDPLGRAFAIVLVVVPAVAIARVNDPIADQALVAVVLAGLWFIGLNVGLAATRTTLAALGTRLALLRGVLLGLVLTAAVGFLVPDLGLGIATTLTIALFVLLCSLLWEALSARMTPPLRVLVVGTEKAGAELARELHFEDDRRFVLVGIVNDQGDGSFVVGSTDDLPDILATTKPHLVVLAPGCNRPEVFSQLLDAAASGFRVVELAQLYEHAFGRVPVRDLTHAWFMSVLHLYQRPYSKLAKRTTDVVGAVTLLLVAAPLFPLLALVVRRTGPQILLRQQRVGEHGKVFTMYKFRTMRLDAERPGEALWAAQDDPRITSAGRIMRRLRLDELPQVWNIFRGEMSLVGPRPERPEFIDELLTAVPWWERRHLVKPGITGWAQVNRGYTADSEGSVDKLSYDLWYIRHRSLTVDLLICAKTVASIVRGDPQPDESTTQFDPLLALLNYSTASQLGPEQIS
jgi:exopolysaccharide biosynthesis polyprenyl glycosylphosphotransferase